MSRESAVCREILAKIYVTKGPVSQVEVPPPLFNMLLIERDKDPRVADVTVVATGKRT